MKNDRKQIRHRIHTRIRKRVSGTAERPRLAVHFSGKHVYAQVIDDDAGRTLAAAGTTEKALAAKSKAAAAKAPACTEATPSWSNVSIRIPMHESRLPA